MLRAVLLCLRGHTHTCLLLTRMVVLSLDIIKRAVCLNYPLTSSTLLSTPSTQAVASCPPCHPCWMLGRQGGEHQQGRRKRGRGGRMEGGRRRLEG